MPGDHQPEQSLFRLPPAGDTKARPPLMSRVEGRRCRVPCLVAHHISVEIKCSGKLQQVACNQEARDPEWWRELLIHSRWSKCPGCIRHTHPPNPKLFFDLNNETGDGRVGRKHSGHDTPRVCTKAASDFSWHGPWRKLRKCRTTVGGC